MSQEPCTLFWPRSGFTPTPSRPTTPAPEPGKTNIVAYINVSSGCQAETVALLKDLVEKHKRLADLELIDFGSPAGESRWRTDGLSCMTLLFDGSPVCRFPGADGQPKTVVFAMPAGFQWTHDDLQEAFAALQAGKLETLSEEEAQREFAPQAVRLATAVRATGTSAELAVNGAPVLSVKVKAGGKTPAERAKAAKAAIDQWAVAPIHPSQLALVTKDTDISIQADAKEIIRVTPADAAEAQAASGKGQKELAREWLKAIKDSVVKASQKAPETKPASARSS